MSDMSGIGLTTSSEEYEATAEAMRMIMEYVTVAFPSPACVLELAALVIKDGIGTVKQVMLTFEFVYGLHQPRCRHQRHNR